MPWSCWDFRLPHLVLVCPSTVKKNDGCGGWDHVSHSPPWTSLYISPVPHRTLGRLVGGLTHLGKIRPCRDHRSSSLRSEDRTLSIVSLWARGMLVQWSQRTTPKGRWLGGPESHQPTELVLQQPSRCSGPQLKVVPEVFGKVLLGAHEGTIGGGNKFPRLNPQKMMLPSVSWKQGQQPFYHVKMTWYLQIESSSHFDEWSK